MEEKKKVKGWLTLLVILCFMRPVGFNNLAQEANYIVLGATAISFYGGHRLWKVFKKSSISIAIACLWLSLPLGSCLFAISKGMPYPEAIGYSIGSAIFAFIWTIYLKRSKQVKSLYVD